VVGAFEEQLDPREASAIAIALERAADLILIDEADGREIANAAGLRVRGILGILRRAKQAGDVTSLRDELLKLRTDAHFFVSPKLTNRFLEASGEA
jgi:predicted nucleic acid-binding protein